MVQVETRVSGQVELLKFRRQILRQSDLSQLVAAQVHALTTWEQTRTLTNVHIL